MWDRKTYPTDLTDAQWAVIEPIVTYRSAQDRCTSGRPRTVNLRRVVDALLYRAYTRVSWSRLPVAFPPSGTVRYYFDKWTWDGTWRTIDDVLRDQVRVAYDRSPTPRAARIDSHTVKTTDTGGERSYNERTKAGGAEPASSD